MPRLHELGDVAGIDPHLAQRVQHPNRIAVLDPARRRVVGMHLEPHVRPRQLAERRADRALARRRDQRERILGGRRIGLEAVEPQRRLLVERRGEQIAPCWSAVFGKTSTNWIGRPPCGGVAIQRSRRSSPTCCGSCAEHAAASRRARPPDRRRSADRAGAHRSHEHVGVRSAIRRPRRSPAAPAAA